jgi:hypothetical protein
MPNSQDILYRASYTRTLIDISSTGYEKKKTKGPGTPSLL